MVAPDINIKMAGNEDVQLLSDLSIATFIETYRGTCPDEDILDFTETYFNENIIADELDDKNDFYFIVFADGFPAGYMRLKEDYNHFPFPERYNAIELKRIYVLKEYQSKKVGVALMKYALEFAKEKGYEAMWLGVWEHNEKAKSFYKKWGFEDEGFTHIFQVGKTAQTDKWLIKFLKA